MRRKKVVLVLATIALLFSMGVGGASAAISHTSQVTGLVFIDSNQNGVWDIGEEGYGGKLQWVADEEVTRYVGTTVTVMTPAYDEYEFETAGYNSSCTVQGFDVDEYGNIVQVPTRPCAGTFGMSFRTDPTGLDIRLEVTATPPEGYKLTSPAMQTFIIGKDTEPLDFGIIPLETETVASESTAGAAESAGSATGGTTPTSYLVYTEGTNFVNGLVFIDENRDGYWEPGEPGYPGVSYWDEDEARIKYQGAKVTLRSSSTDEIELDSAGHEAALGGEGAICSVQGVNRPCDGTWGLTGAGDKTFYEIWLTVPDGYELTTSNPLTFYTGSDAPLVDFGIAPIEAD